MPCRLLLGNYPKNFQMLVEKLQKISKVLAEQEFIQSVDTHDAAGNIPFKTTGFQAAITLSEARLVVTIREDDNPDNWNELLASSSSTRPLLSEVKIIFFNSYGFSVDKDEASRIDIQSRLFDTASDPILYSELATLICGVASLDGSILATRDFYEGREISSVSKRYERSSALRDKAILIHGLTCSICGFNFQAAYGDLGKDFIHIHHVDRVADGGVRVVDAASDLIPICPNCHSMIHKETPPLRPEILRRIVEDHKYES